jgi:hypothetical protein
MKILSYIAISAGSAIVGAYYNTATLHAASATADTVCKITVAACEYVVKLIG